jgi:hypothetical protein
MLQEVLRVGASDRKLRLFALAVCVASWGGVGRARQALYRATEEYVEDTARVKEVRKQWGGQVSCWPERAAEWAVEVAKTRSERQRRLQRALVHCVFGNPFRPSSLLPGPVLTWNDGTVRRIAEGIYQARAFGRLPILADALLDAGCDDEAILAHCREPGPHVRGCWVVDLILGKS